MNLDKMKNVDTSIYVPDSFSYEIKVGDAAVKVPINIEGDTISWVCGSADGTSFCGS